MSISVKLIDLLTSSFLIFLIVERCMVVLGGEVGSTSNCAELLDMSLKIIECVDF